MHDGKIALVFGGDERIFRFGISELIALEEACDRPASEMNERFGFLFGRPHRWFVRDVLHILRIGLQGGGMDPTKVRQLLDEVLPGNVYEAAKTASLALQAGMLPLELETPGEAEGGEDDRSTNVSPPPRSSAKARFSGSRRRQRSP